MKNIIKKFKQNLGNLVLGLSSLIVIGDGINEIITQQFIRPTTFGIVCILIGILAIISIFDKN